MPDLIDLRISDGLVLPMDRDGSSVRGDVLIDKGRIVEVRRGSAPDIPARQVLDASDAIVMPGLIQGHVHVAQSLLRHQADELELLDWLRLRTWPYEAALDGDDTEIAAELGIAELLAGGTTCAVDFGAVHFQHRVFEAAERTGIRMVSGKIHMDEGRDVPGRLIEDPQRSLAEAEALGSRWHRAAGGRLRYAAAPRFALSCTRELMAGCRDLARRNGWMIQSHASENRDEVAAVRTAYGVGNVAALEALGLAGPDVILAHAVWLDDHEYQILADTGTIVCHCPGANLKLGSGIADVPRLRQTGVRVMLGADGPPCNNRLSAFSEMALAATLHGIRRGPRALTAWNVLAMATREAAAAVGLGGLIGTLEAGKAADVIVIGLEDWALQPGGDPAARIVYGGTAGSVRHVVVDGAVLMRDGCLASIHAQDLRRRAVDSWRAVSSRMEEVA